MFRPRKHGKSTWTPWATHCSRALDSMLTPIAEPTGLMKSLDERFPYPGKQLLRDSVRSMPFARSVLRQVEDTAFAWMNHPRGIYAYCPCIPDIGVR